MSEQSNQRMSFRESIGRDPNNPQGQLYSSEQQPGYQPPQPEVQHQAQPMTQQGDPLQVQMMPNDRPVSGFAVTSMVLGILSVLAIFFGILGVLLGLGALIFGILAQRNIKKDSKIRGKGMAITGLVTGSIGFILSLAFTIFTVVLAVDVYNQLEEYNGEIGEYGQQHLDTDQDVYFDEDGLYLE